MKKARRTEGLAAYRRKTLPEGSVRMCLNENPFRNPGKLTLSPEEQSLYPDEYLLTEKIADQWNTPAENVILFNGASEGIMCAALAFADPQDRVLISEPEFALIPHYLRLAGAEPEGIPMGEGLEFDIKAMENTLETSVNSLFISIPNNPTGASIENQVVLEWCTSFPETLFIIDEAYGAFTGSRLAERSADYRNLLVIRSFSKDSALAGLRLGAASGSRELIQVLKCVRTPFSINAGAIKAALMQTMNSSSLQSIRKSVSELAVKTRRAGLNVKEGGGNFFLITDEDADSFCDFCEERGVLLRSFRNGNARVSPSNRKGNAQYMKCLEAWRMKNVQSRENNS